MRSHPDKSPTFPPAIMPPSSLTGSTSFSNRAGLHDNLARLVVPDRVPLGHGSRRAERPLDAGVSGPDARSVVYLRGFSLRLSNSHAGHADDLCPGAAGRARPCGFALVRTNV